MSKNIFSRPLSPHLSIHKKFFTSVLSISHRITGFVLNLGTILIVFWIFLLAFNESYFICINDFFKTYFGKIILFIWSFAIFYHLINGIRYLFWSFGFGIHLKNIYISGYIVLILSIFVTIILWLLALGII